MDTQKEPVSKITKMYGNGRGRITEYYKGFVERLQAACRDYKAFVIFCRYSFRIKALCYITEERYIFYIWCRLTFSVISLEFISFFGSLPYTYGHPHSSQQPSMVTNIYTTMREQSKNNLQHNNKLKK